MNKERIIDLEVNEFKTLLEKILDKNLKQAIRTIESSEKLLTRKEVSKRLNISLSTLNDYTHRGILKAHKIGNRVYYRWSEIIDAAINVEPRKTAQ